MEEIRTPLAVIRRLLANNQSSSDTAVQDHFKAALDGKWEQVHAQPMRVLLNQGIESRERECPVHARALAGRCTPLVCEAVTGIFLPALFSGRSSCCEVVQKFSCPTTPFEKCIRACRCVESGACAASDALTLYDELLDRCLCSMRSMVSNS